MMHETEEEQSDEEDVEAEVCPTEDTVLALLELLVEPLLPSCMSVNDVVKPSLSQEEAVAKQMHAVVLLYNYYHRKQCPDLEFLEFDSFCKLARLLKRNLFPYMKLMELKNYADLNDRHKHLSLTEKKIMEACDISKCLDASKDIPVTQGWPISGVAVFLCDIQKENCHLLHSKVTQGLWSLLEKEVNVTNKSSVPISEASVGKRQIMEKPLEANENSDKTALLQLAYSAVKDAYGFWPSDLNNLESHVVYSLAKEKSTTCFYIMQCKRRSHYANVPIRDVMDSLQGFLMMKEAHSWSPTAVVEYFHLLPYADILSDWLSRSIVNTEVKIAPEENINNTAANNSVKAGSIADGKNRTHQREVHADETTANESTMAGSLADGKSKNFPDERCEDTALDESAKSGSKADGESRIRSDKDHAHDTTVDESTMAGYRRRNRPRDNRADDSEKTLVLERSSLSIRTTGVTCPGQITENCPRISENNTDRSESNIPKAPDQDVVRDSSLAGYDSSSKQVDKLQLTIASKEKLLSQAALKVLRRKREMLSLQLRDIEDKIALCDRSIQTVLSGGEDDLAVKLDCVIEGCNDIDMYFNATTSFQDGSCQHLQDHDFSHHIKRKKLSANSSCSQSPCQELDGICYGNSWILPRYHVSAAEGGFLASVTVKGTYFECSNEGHVCASPHEARECAAIKMLAKLRKLPTATL